VHRQIRWCSRPERASGSWARARGIGAGGAIGAAVANGVRVIILAVGAFVVMTVFTRWLGRPRLTREPEPRATTMTAHSHLHRTAISRQVHSGLMADNARESQLAKVYLIY
jgi:hypothetical protein